MARKSPSKKKGRRAVRHAHLVFQIDRYLKMIESIIDQVDAGVFGDLRTIPGLKRELVSVAKQLRDAEIQFDEQKNKNEGRQSGSSGGIDMPAARTEIGRRLDLLRKRGRADSVS